MHFIHSYIKNLSVWDPTAHFKLCEVRICILEGPEDDSIRIETCCPNNKVLLCLTDTSLYIYVSTVLRRPDDGSSVIRNMLEHF